MKLRDDMPKRVTAGHFIMGRDARFKLGEAKRLKAKYLWAIVGIDDAHPIHLYEVPNVLRNKAYKAC